MKKIILIFIIVNCSVCFGELKPNIDYENKYGSLTITHVTLDANNIVSYIWSTGIFNQNPVIQNYAGFEWPKGSGKTALYTAGLTIGAYVNNQIRLATASYRGEYIPGYCVNGVFHTDARFKIFKVSRNDNLFNNPDWLNWGLMVPYGAPYIDHNNNGIYEPFIDTPGVKGAAQTIFLCMTDADSNTHSNSEGFSGGTNPLYAEVHLTAWCYDNPGFQDMQFFKWVVINKGINRWDSTIFSIVTDPDLGEGNDDYIGCDTTRNLAYCFNATDQDGSGSGQSYGANPPAVGIMFLNCLSVGISMKTFDFFTGSSIPNPACERDPSLPINAYNYINGKKGDGTPWLNAYTIPPQITKFCYSGDPETNTGWTEYVGKIDNCGGGITGNLIPSPPGDRRFLLASGNNHILNPGDSQVVQICQLITRGSNNKNSVTRLKLLADVAKNLCENNFVIGVTTISTQVPNSFALYQNYPNPFNPTTKIKFDVPQSIPPLKGESTYGARGMIIQLKVYDALGREVAMLVNEKLNPGTYEVEWDGTNYPSGVYFYRLEVGDYNQTKKLVLLK